MIALDTNILVYAHRPEFPLHEAAVRALATLVESGSRCAIPWPCVHEFLATVTNPRLFRTPTPLELALAAVDELLSLPRVRLLAEADDYWSVLRKQLSLTRVVGGKLHDARIACLCLQHGVTELWSADRDFSRFAALRVRNPLVSAG